MTRERVNELRYTPSDALQTHHLKSELDEMVKLAVEIVELLELVVDRHGVVAKVELGAHAVGGARQTSHAGHIGNGVVFFDDLIQQRVGRLVVLVLETRSEIRY